MTRDIKIRILAFVVLSALGIVYVAAAYLGLVDRILGRQLVFEATLPTSGGLYQGSAVTYRGVKVGKVSRMSATRDGVTLTLTLEDGTKIPRDSPMYVHNLSAIGEQYLDFEPTDDRGPYAANGDTMAGDASSIPVDEGDLLVNLDQLVESVDKPALRTTVRELGDMFTDTGEPLQQIIDQGGRFIDEAVAHDQQTTTLLRTGETVLRTQQGQRENIRSFSRDLRLLTDSLRRGDGDLRQVLQGTPPAAREVQALLRGLQPTLPVLLGNAISVNQVVVNHLRGVEQLLVTFPRTISAGFTGSTPDGYGHVNLQFDQDPQPCTVGYKPVKDWRKGNDLSDGPIFPAKCESGPPINMRGSNYAPGTARNPAPAAYESSYDPRTGVVDGAVDASGQPIRVVPAADMSALGDQAWKWLLIGPVQTG